MPSSMYKLVVHIGFVLMFVGFTNIIEIAEPDFLQQEGWVSHDESNHWIKYIRSIKILI